VQRIRDYTEQFRYDENVRAQVIHDLLQSLEALVADGWVIASHDPSMPLIDMQVQTHGGLRWNDDPVPTL
jgi:hypothetical protein